MAPKGPKRSSASNSLYTSERIRCCVGIFQNAEYKSKVGARPLARDEELLTTSTDSGWKFVETGEVCNRLRVESADQVDCQCPCLAPISLPPTSPPQERCTIPCATMQTPHLSVPTHGSSPRRMQNAECRMSRAGDTYFTSCLCVLAKTPKPDPFALSKVRGVAFFPRQDILAAETAEVLFRKKVQPPIVQNCKSRTNSQ